MSDVDWTKLCLMLIELYYFWGWLDYTMSEVDGLYYVWRWLDYTMSDVDWTKLCL